MILFPAFWPGVRAGDPVLPMMHHTPYPFYVRVAEPTELEPAPPARYGRQNLPGYDYSGEYEDLIEPSELVRIAGDPKLIDGSLVMAVKDIEDGRYHLRRFSSSVKPAEEIWDIEASQYGGGTYNLLSVFPARKCAVVDRRDSPSSVQFKRYSDGASWYYLPDSKFQPPSSAFSFDANDAALDLAFNCRNASYGYNRSIASNEWAYAAGYGGNIKRIIGFKGRSLEDDQDPQDEKPLWISDANVPSGNCYEIHALAVVGDDHCVMQAAFLTFIPNPNPSTSSPYNPYRTSGALYSCRVFRIDLIAGQATYTEIGRVVNEWTQIEGTGDGSVDGNGNPIPAYYEPTQTDAGGYVITGLTRTDDGEAMETYPWNGANAGTSNTHAWLCEINPSLRLGMTRRLDGGTPIIAYSRDQGATWTDLPQSVNNTLGTGNRYRGAYCVRKDLKVKKARKDWIISKELQI